MRSFPSSLLVGSFVTLLAMFTLGCGTGSNEPGASTGEIQAYIEANPDKVAKPEDSPADEAAEFAAGGE